MVWDKTVPSNFRGKVVAELADFIAEIENSCESVAEHAREQLHNTEVDCSLAFLSFSHLCNTDGHGAAGDHDTGVLTDC